MKGRLALVQTAGTLATTSCATLERRFAVRFSVGHQLWGVTKQFRRRPRLRRPPRDDRIVFSFTLHDTRQNVDIYE